MNKIDIQTDNGQSSMNNQLHANNAEANLNSQAHTDTHKPQESDALASDYIASSSPSDENTPTIALDCSSLPVKLSKDITSALKSLEDVKHEIITKITLAQERKAIIDQRMGILVEKGARLEERRTAFNASVETYVMLLQDVVQEINHELAFYQPFKDSADQKILHVPKDTFEKMLSREAYVENSIKSIKSQVKSIKKYLAISFSRYSYGFDTQARSLDNIEHLALVSTK